MAAPIASLAPAHPRSVRAGGIPEPTPSIIDVLPLASRDLAHWEQYVRSHPGGSIFHSVAWMHSVRDAFGHQPHYLLARRDGQVVGVLPLFQVDSFLAGRMLVSVPYAVGGGVVADSQPIANALLDAAKTLAATIGVGVIDLRSAEAQFPDLLSNDRYVTFQRQLPDRPDDVPDWLPRKARAAARNASAKYGLYADFSPEHLPTVWRLYCRNMRRLASACYPYRFFEELHERNSRNTVVQIIRLGRRPVAGLVSFRFGDTFTPYFAGCHERFQGLGANNLLYLTAMKKAIELGCRTFDFGRTRLDNRGCFDFKRFHGFEPRTLGYQMWLADGARSPELTPSNPRFRLIRRLWPHLPLGVSTCLGVWAARHIPG